MKYRMQESKEIIDKIRAYQQQELELRLSNYELKRLNDALKKAEERSAILNSIIESTDDGIISKNLNSVITSWNNAASRIFGYTEDEMIGESILKLIPEHLQDQETKFLEKLKSGKLIDHFQTQRLRKDGTFVDVSLTISPIYDSWGKLIGLSKIVHDITNEKIAESVSQRLAAIVESSDDAIISKDFNSIVTSWNEAATRIFGYSASEMIGESILKLIPNDRLDEEPKILAQLREGIRVEHFETERLRKDGTLISVSLTISPVKDLEGNIIGLSKIARDITEKSLVEKKKNEFVSFVSHELKTPLTSLKSYLQMALLKSNDADFTLKALTKADVQTKKMEHLIRDFLNISRFEEGQISIKQAQFDIAKLIADCIEDAGITSHKHTVIYDGISSVIVHGDEEKIMLVLTNLISNAQKYSPIGGEINISCTLIDQKAVVKVKDNGMGIALEDQKNMFQKFFRVENEQTKFISGFGIGLYLSSTILKLHKSTLKVESEIGKGSIFYFSLPLSK
ncbi:PAS domain S-box protein [Pedobacter aquatilis]|uniref:PAS domain S-box protein n=1 Tax=Pedobacter aquatilis TaxID=351343 RepID=UPI0025B2FC88|nr:PAS domain S-box protein [Pedobacter aquatilis]MDN3588280.1 PAS domain S-box protein [Pedobacter aquatilis]